MNLSSRLPDVGTTIFSIMSKMALVHNAINLSQGFPDFPVSEKLIDLIHQKMKEGHNQYAPMPGVEALRNIIRDIILKTYRHEVNAETEITITAGGTEAIFSSIAALIRPGDEVILFDPSYDSYDPAIRLSGGTPVHLNLSPPHFAIDWSEVKKKITPRTRLIMVNTPHNPAGAVLSSSDLQSLEMIAAEHNLIVLSDEVYERIIFDGRVHESVLKYPALAQQSIAVFSFGKTFHATGWKVGYTVAPEAITQEIRKAHQFVTFSVNTPVQLALAEFMADPENYLHLGKFYQQKRDFFLEQIKGTSLRPLPCSGSYFQLLSYEGVSQKTDRDMAIWMTQEMKLAPIPVSAFYKDQTDNKLLRFCFAKNENTLRKAGEILKKI
ncbi:MAG: aminotransferase class I/II-fold pyridoxal phosphate-dependent enzyme [Bacteroidetes bacterium]|nr:aminotransferase class I/II-fold pyridoxal phosphate-dependent enzyme [Bacteroidota bacterium]MBS1540188.1 aminotransferase class I/II-fold pyridoxal phosphate-dependent enzyme [Bacteroidota bacterium]